MLFRSHRNRISNFRSGGLVVRQTDFHFVGAVCADYRYKGNCNCQQTGRRDRNPNLFFMLPISYSPFLWFFFISCTLWRYSSIKKSGIFQPYCCHFQVFKLYCSQFLIYSARFLIRPLLYFRQIYQCPVL